MPFEFHLRLKMVRWCMDKTRWRSPEGVQIRAIPSSVPVARRVPSDWRTRRMSASLSDDNLRLVREHPLYYKTSPRTKTLTLTFHSTAVTSDRRCPDACLHVMGSTGLPPGDEGTSHMRAVESPEPVASRPGTFGFQLQGCTACVWPFNWMTLSLGMVDLDVCLGASLSALTGSDSDFAVTVLLDMPDASRVGV